MRSRGLENEVISRKIPNATLVQSVHDHVLFMTMIMFIQVFDVLLLKSLSLRINVRILSFNFVIELNGPKFVINFYFVLRN